MITNDALRFGRHKLEIASPLVLLLVFAFLVGMLLQVREFMPAWVWMWTLAVSLFGASKLLILLSAGRVIQRIPLVRRAAYLALDPNLDPKPHATHLRKRLEVTSNLYRGLINIACGAWLLWVVGPQIADIHFRAWMGMIAIALMLHFGVFQIAAVAWRFRGVPVDSLMNKPILANSVGEFWGVRWNKGFNYLVKTFVFKPIAKGGMGGLGMFAAFVISGLIHEAVITLPAGGGFGQPTFYFLIQWLGILIEKRLFAPGKHLKFRWDQKLFTLFIILAPVPLLFPPVFLEEVIYPMVRFLTE